MHYIENIGLALILTLIAGLSTGIGSIIAYFIKKPKLSYLCFSLGFSAGVMIYVSFAELLPIAMSSSGEFNGLAFFFLGIGFIALIDIFIPEAENPHAFKDGETIKNELDKKTLKRVGILTALTIAIHNFPEGIATFGTALADINLGVVIALAVAIHNIPEGISVSMPIFYATGSKKKAFLYSFSSGFAEPLGAIIGFLFLITFLSDELIASLLGFVAGIMIYISIDEILPVANQYGRSHIVILGVISGLFVMAYSITML